MRLEETKTFICTRCNSDVEVDVISDKALTKIRKLKAKVEQLEKELTLNIVEVDFQKHLNSRLVELVETVIGQEEWDQKRQQIQDQLNEILNDKEQAK